MPKRKRPEAELRDNLLTNHGILPKWHNVGWEDFDNDPKALTSLRTYSDNAAKYFDLGVGLFIYGLNGVGKTQLMNTLLIDLFERKYSVRVITLGTLITKYTSAAWYGGTDKAFYEIIAKPHFLGIEEIGKEYKSGSNDLALMVFDSVLRYRLQAKLPIIFTTNLTPKDIDKTYSPDIASMLRECCITVPVTGDDRRIKIREELKQEFAKDVDAYRH